MPTKTDRVQIDYCLKFTTLFHCGTGMRMGLVDRTVIRDSEDYLYVPGSTFKGVLRERCEQLARFYEDEAGKELVASPHDAEKALRGLGTRPPTMVTRIFGSHNVPGRLFFDDARLSEEDQKLYIRARDDEPGGERRVQDAGQKEESAQEAEQKKDRPANRLDYKGLQVDLYTQVRLDRLTRTSVEGALYTSEFGTRDLTFNGSVLGWLECTVIDGLHNERYPDSSPTYSLLLLLAGLRMMERLGANKSTGKGQCICDIQAVELNGHRFETEEWTAWLDDLDQLIFYSHGGEGTGV